MIFKRAVGNAIKLTFSTSDKKILLCAYLIHANEFALLDLPQMRQHEFSFDKNIYKVSFSGGGRRMTVFSYFE